MVPMRRRCPRISSSDSAATSTPPMLSEPDVGRSVRLRMRKSVVLPAPLGPITATCSPGPTVREIPSTATVPSGKTLRSSRSSYTGWMGPLLLQEPRRNGRVFRPLPVGVVGFDVLLRAVEVQQPAVLGVVVVELEERRRDLLLQPLVQLTAGRPDVVHIGWRGVEDVDLGEVHLLGLDQLVPD